jgi:hypothetical protein
MILSPRSLPRATFLYRAGVAQWQDVAFDSVQVSAGKGSLAGKGRPKGSKNKKSAEVRAAAQVYTQESLRTLVRLMRGQNVRGKGRSEVLPQMRLFVGVDPPVGRA